MNKRFPSVLQRLGLLSLSFSVYEWALVLRAWKSNRRYQTKAGPDGLPIPPPQMRVRVALTADIPAFLNGGERAASSIVDTLKKNRVEINDFKAILDFGCGCGRVVRQWRGLKTTKVYGTDYNPKLVDWCRKNLPMAEFGMNQLSPPLSYPDAKFDFIYSLSVFTHLPEDLQRRWLNELMRILKPGGYFLMTTLGELEMHRLSREEKEQFRQGRLVLHRKEVAGNTLCAAYHPSQYVRRELAGAFEVTDFVPGGALGNAPQDIWLLRKPVRSSVPAEAPESHRCIV